MTSTILQFAHDNPLLSSFLACPLFLFLIAVSWLVASNVETGMNLILRLANLAVIAIRGYPQPGTPPIPASVETEADDDGK